MDEILPQKGQWDSVMEGPEEAPWCHRLAPHQGLLLTMFKNTQKG